MPESRRAKRLFGQYGRTSSRSSGVKLEHVGDDYSAEEDTCIKAFVRLIAAAAAAAVAEANICLIQTDVFICVCAAFAPPRACYGRVFVSTFKHCSNTLFEHTANPLFKRLNSSPKHCSNTYQLEGCTSA